MRFIPRAYCSLNLIQRSVNDIYVVSQVVKRTRLLLFFALYTARCRPVSDVQMKYYNCSYGGLLWPMPTVDARSKLIWLRNGVRAHGRHLRFKVMGFRLVQNFSFATHVMLHHSGVRELHLKCRVIFFHDQTIHVSINMCGYTKHT